jgi:peptidoglycan hydrolase-like protein with peptidoglycan-binding domain
MTPEKGTHGTKEPIMTQTALAPWPVIAQPMQGPPIQALQHLLRQHGSNITADGVFGPKTDAAVKAFQQSHGLVADGKVGPKTWPKLIVTVRRNDRGEAVKGAQLLCVDVTVDGIFGPQTEAGVKTMQGFFGITVDGIVGPVTWQALVSNGD